MKLSGNKRLLTPKLPILGFELRNITLNSWDNFSFGWTVHNSANPFDEFLGNVTIFSCLSGRILDSWGRFVNTYNLNEPFNVSGWYSNTQPYLDINGCQVPTDYRAGVVHDLFVKAPSTGIVDMDAKILLTAPINYSLQVPNYGVGQYVTGVLTSDTPIEVYGHTFTFFNSYEQLLVGAKASGNLYANSGFQMQWRDNDSSIASNEVDGIFYLQTLGGASGIPFLAYRSAYTTGVYRGLSSGAASGWLGSEFFGEWANNRFTFREEASSTIFDFNYTSIDIFGVPQSKTLKADITGGVFTGRYITGFNLTSSGLYDIPPTAEFTGYYYVTGLQTPLSSLLFSSGCTGNIPISFTALGGYGAGASGYLETQPIVLSGIYINNKTYYLPIRYVAYSSGSGYTMDPLTVVSTGTVGPNCYDVPAALGNQAWYVPSTGWGARYPQAAFLTGYPLGATGISGEMRYQVTGIEVTNIGSGYDPSILIPKMRFVRQVGDVQTVNASGNFAMVTNTYNFTSSMVSGAVSVGNQPFVSYTWGTPITMDNDETDIRFQMNITGAITNRVTGSIIVSDPYVQSPDTPMVNTSTWVFQKTFSTETGALKKNNNLDYFFSGGSELSFSLTQDELDELYSSPEFAWDSEGIEIGDVDF